MGNSWKFVLKKHWQGEKCKSPQAETIYKIHKISPAQRAGCKKNVFPQRKRHKKKEHLERDAPRKMGGDLLFHKQVQYHQRGRA